MSLGLFEGYVDGLKGIWGCLKGAWMVMTSRCLAHDQAAVEAGNIRGGVDEEHPEESSAQETSESTDETKQSSEYGKVRLPAGIRGIN